MTSDEFVTENVGASGDYDTHTVPNSRSKRRPFLKSMFRSWHKSGNTFCGIFDVSNYLFMLK